MPTFTAIDFETANGSRASACSIAAVVMDETGQVLASRSDLLRPAPGCDEFHPRNVAIHGITPQMVSGAPGWADVADAYLDLIGTGPVVAHNMAFDFSVWSALAGQLGTPTLDSPRLCTYRTAATLLKWQRGTMKLDMVFGHYFPGETFQHHRADADALACARILVAEMADAGVDLTWMVENMASTGPAGPSRRTRQPRSN